VSRLRTFAAFTALAAFMCLGIGTAAAASNASGASQQSNSSIVSNDGSGGLSGGVKGNAGTVAAGQSNNTWSAVDVYY